MGWANCGDDSQGRPIGYAVDAICDYPDCSREIHRGLAHACGNMHGETEYSCEGYFCYKHLQFPPMELDKNVHPWEQTFCPDCIELLEEDMEED